MITKIFAFFTLACLALSLTGCYYGENIYRQSIRTEDKPTILKVVTIDHDMFIFQNEFKGEYGAVEDSVITGILADGGKTLSDPKNSRLYKSAMILDPTANRKYERISIPLSRADQIYVRKTDVALTILVVTGVAIIVGGAVFMMSFGGIHGPFI